MGPRVPGLYATTLIHNDIPLVREQFERCQASGVEILGYPVTGDDQPPTQQRVDGLEMGEATIVSTDTPEFWNDIWADIEDCGSGSDEILVDQVERLTPGRALDIGCDTGRNAVWLAEHDWQVTAMDYSVVAIEKGKRLAAERGVNVEFVVADGSTHQPQGHYDLITCCYIQMFPRQRAKMLAEMSKALVPGGTFLFVSHDKSGPPSGWSAEDLLSLTTPEEIVAELAELRIEQSFVLNHDGEGSQASHVHHDGGDHEPDEAHESHGSSSTIVRAIRPAQ